MRMYIGKITKVDKDKVYLINFIIPGIYEDDTKPLVAVPLGRLSRMPLVGDEVSIIKPEDDIDIFYYILNHEDGELVSIQYNKDNYIKLNKSSDKVNIEIKCSGDMNIYASGSVNINSGSSGKVLVNNHLEVTS